MSGERGEIVCFECGSCGRRTERLGDACFGCGARGDDAPVVVFRLVADGAGIELDALETTRGQLAAEQP